LSSMLVNLMWSLPNSRTQEVRLAKCMSSLI
jgi:hypothetical protein